MQIEIEEGERQLMLMALAYLSLIRPGFDFALNNLALKMDNNKAGRGVLYDAFRRIELERGAE